MMCQKLVKYVVFIIVLTAANSAFSMDVPLLSIADSDGTTKSFSLTLQIVILMTLLSVLPALLLTMTSFTRILIVLSILRQAIGMPQTPSNQILIGISLFMTLFVMSPVLSNIYDSAVEPLTRDKIEFSEALEKSSVPIKKFMLQQVRNNDVEFFIELGKKNNVKNAVDIVSVDENISFGILLPAFVTSELKTAFQIGFFLFIPFLIIDLIVASVLMSMGMMMLSPLIISLPFKIMLFVLVDGWGMVVGSLASSFSGVGV